MTVRIPSPNITDRLLNLIGKKRAVYLPDNLGRFDPYYQAKGIKKSFWKSLMRPKDEKLPKNAVDVFLIKKLQD